jgi:hypothetical protein
MFIPEFKNNRMASRIALTVVLLVLLSACKAPVIVEQPSAIPFSVKRLLILPFRDMSVVYGVNENIRCPVCGKMVMAGEVAEGAAEFMSESFFNLLKNTPDIELVTTEQAQGTQSDLLAGEKGIRSEHELLVESGRALKADAVLAGYIFRFRERVGTGYSVKSPASVAFDLHFMRVADGRILWSGHFDETQKALSEDLYQLDKFIKRKASWITAREMAQTGLENILQTLSGFGIRTENPK